MIKTPLSAAIGGAFWTPSATILGSTSKTFNQLIKSLFANGEQGFAYDPNDLSTMYQDAAGTVPVTGAGQLVGLMLDKSKGLVLGSELFAQVVNFSVWTKTAAVTSASGNTFTTNALGGCFKNPIENGMSNKKTYRVRIVGTCTVAHKIRSPSSSIGEVSIAAGAFDITIASPITFSDGSIYFQLQAAGTMTVNSISIKELAGNHTYQSNAASRPLLQRNATTGAYYLAFDGSDDFLVTNSIDFTSTDKISLFVGVRKLSDSTAFPLIVETGNSATVLGSFHLYANASTTQRGYAFAATGATQVWRSMAGDYASPDSAVITAFPNLSAAGGLAVKLRRNGVNQTLVGGAGDVTGGGNFDNLPLYIGRRGGTTLPFNGHIYSLIGIGRLTTDAEATSLEKSIAKNVGVTL